MIVDFLLCVFLFAAAYSDHRKFKIPNSLILVGTFTAIIVNTLIGNVSGLAESFKGGLVAFAIGFLLWKLRVFKAGDGKLLMMIGFFEGMQDMWKTLGAAIIAAGILSLFLMIKNHQIKNRLQRVWYHVKLMLLKKKYEEYIPLENDQIKLPFAVPVFIGVLVYKIFIFVSREGVML